jgi:hypothetical protein
MNKEEWDKFTIEQDKRKKIEIDKMYNLKDYPEHLRKIVQIILDDGEMLTDGITYYAGYDEILKFAEDIYKVIKE